MALLAAASACEIDHEYVEPVNSLSLQRYADVKRFESIDIPAFAVEAALEFDAYLKLPDEQKASDKIVVRYMTDKGENVYGVLMHENPYIQFLVNTGGVSIWDANAVWKLQDIAVGGYAVEDGEIAMFSPKDSCWSVQLEELFVSKVKLNPTAEGYNDWSVETRGTETASDGITAEFMTAGPLRIREIQENNYWNMAYEGKFNVSIFRDGEPYDYCYVTYSEGKSTVYKTSRD